MRVTVYGRNYYPAHWPYGSYIPPNFTPERYIETLIDDGFATARLLFMRNVYTAAEMEEHMTKTVEMPLFGCLCPHRVLPDNCSKCCGKKPEYWMKP
jgi:hypothetical protein